MEEKQFCCCGASGWTRVIGWFDLVFSVLGIIVVSLLLLGTSAVSPDDLANAPGTGLPPGDRKTASVILTVAAVALGFMLVVFVVSLAMAVILLKGSYNKNPRYLHAWVVVQSILLIITLINYLVQTCYSQNGGELASNLLTMIISGVVGGFCIYVVNTHKKEMEASYIPVYPVKA